MQQFPLDAARADMLPTVLSQVQDFLAGRSPYGESLLPGAHTVVRCYWPALWGPFIPFFMLGVDIRFLNLLAQLVFYVLITECYLRRKVVFGWGWRLDSTVFFLVLSLHLFSKQAIRDVYDVQTGALWLFYALFLWSILRERPGLTDVVIPFLILSRQPAFLLVVPYWIWLGKREGRRLRKSLLITLVLALAISLPFLILDANGFFRGIFFYSSVAAQTPAEVTLAWHGLLGVLKITGLDSLALPLQVGGLALGIYWAMKNENKDPIFVLGLGALVYAWFMLFVAVTFKYLFIEPVMVLYFLAFAAGLPRQQTNSGYSP